MRSADARIKQFRSELSRLDLSRLDLGRTEVIGVEMDLRSRRSVLDACSRLTTLLAEKWTQEQRAEYTLGTQGQNHTLIDCLICNAGIATGDAIMTVNWLHHVVMIEQLRKHTRRVVCLSSIAHAIGRLPAQPALDVELIEGGTSWFGHELLRYASSKLAMLLEVQYLHQNGVEAYAVHPGWVATEMVNQLRFTCLFAKSVQYGAMTVAAVALKTNVIPGGYHETGRPIRTFPSAHGLAHGYRLLRQQALGMIDQDRSDRPRPV
ncbi:hypothetical protein GNI_048170 [Gregarina niphandrodes]|uniref:Uncharacterized protein n=1 Tax=Gregarina niphandrodes TaxID=110365 RepID=A0A023B9N0_GRENI|nr:hypothetical protein GNI_048170 [Gregarina niphandrodes]EZG73790.1 hypothetical protein GNI_048170 [Gregarina niphandrodes]|eukprot:XP_011129643.1 hypothetical protein GNI_048170 [Gregarina niphandrodes]